MRRGQNSVNRIVLFSVSNEVPEHPVLSPVSGCIYERRLIEKYIQENSADPMNGEKLALDMLIDIKSKYKVNRAAQKAPPTDIGCHTG